MVHLQAEDSLREAFWLIQNGKATLQATDAKDEDAKDPLAATLKSILESKDLQRFQLQIQILSRADAKKFSSPDDSSPSPEE